MLEKKSVSLFVGIPQRYLDEIIQNNMIFNFSPRSNEVDYVWVTKDEGCYSYLGKITGRQTLSLQGSVGQTGCFWDGIIVHEFIHAIGFLHEQSRPDRDSFVQINFENIRDEKFKPNFERTDNSLAFGVEYDGKSVMHYGRNAFSIDPEKDTIFSKVCTVC